MADTQEKTEAKKPADKQQGGPPKGGAQKSAKESGAPKGTPKDGGGPKVKKPRVRSDYVARLRTHFEQVIRPELTKQFSAFFRQAQRDASLDGAAPHSETPLFEHRG